MMRRSRPWTRPRSTRFEHRYWTIILIIFYFSVMCFSEISWRIYFLYLYVSAAYDCSCFFFFFSSRWRLWFWARILTTGWAKRMDWLSPWNPKWNLSLLPSGEEIAFYLFISYMKTNILKMKLWKRISFLNTCGQANKIFLRKFYPNVKFVDYWTNRFQIIYINI